MKNKKQITKKLVTRKPDFESISLGLSAWINTAKSDNRTYLVVVDSLGNRFFLNKTEVS